LPSAEQLAEAFKKSMTAADALAAQRDQDGAIRAYQKIAADNPSREEPWVKIGQIHFSQGRYSLALVAAEEALQRDPADRQARSITAVSGLRLAARSLEELRKDNSLSGDVDADARRLALLLRESLGQPVLLPDTQNSRPPRPVVRRPATAPAAPAASAASTAPARAAPPRTSGGNPLDAFK
jgi:tetratricopeptide (TPR) repeat protein